MNLDSVNLTDAPERKERHLWLDAVRVPALMLIIWFHLGNFDKSWQIFQPLLCFFFLSGYLTSAERFSYSKWWRRLVTLALPYFIWNTLCIPCMPDDFSLARIYGFGPVGRFCADYPLWYLRALFLMTLAYPLFRKVLWLPVVGSAPFVFWGDSWHCTWASNVPLPDPTVVQVFFLGCLLNRYQPEAFRGQLLRSGLPLVLVLICNAFFPILDKTVSKLLGVFSLFALAAWLPVFPRICRAVAEVSRATFLAFATHAGVITFVQRHFPFNANNMFIAILLVVIAYAVAYGCLFAMEKFCPCLAPYLAHQGRLKWLYTR